MYETIISLSMSVGLITHFLLLSGNAISNVHDFYCIGIQFLTQIWNQFQEIPINIQSFQSKGNAFDFSTFCVKNNWAFERAGDVWNNSEKLNPWSCQIAVWYIVNINCTETWNHSKLYTMFNNNTLGIQYRFTFNIMSHQKQLFLSILQNRGSHCMLYILVVRYCLFSAISLIINLRMS